MAETDEHGGALDDYFARARSIVLLTANSPAFANVLAEPGTRREKVRRQGRSLARGHAEPRSIWRSSIRTASARRASSMPTARSSPAWSAATIAPAADLSTEEEKAPFFAPAFALDFGQTHQTRPYVSPDTGEWVVANATLIPQPDGAKRAIVHFEVTVESFRRAMGDTQGAELRVVDGQTGRVVIDGGREQRAGAQLGSPEDTRFVALTRGADTSGITEVDGRKVAYRRIARTAGNANDWIVRGVRDVADRHVRSPPWGRRRSRCSPSRW